MLVRLQDVAAPDLSILVSYGRSSIVPAPPQTCHKRSWHGYCTSCDQSMSNQHTRWTVRVLWVTTTSRTC